jgi:hypothetical protein
MEPSSRVNMRPANFLDWVLIGKMIMTLIWVASLLLSGWLWERAEIPEPKPMIFVILLAGAYIALFVGYARGYRDRKYGENIRTVVIVGIVSNGLAALFLLAFGIVGSWSSWGWSSWGGWAQGGMWGSAITAGAITAGLLYALLVTHDRTLAKLK